MPGDIAVADYDQAAITTGTRTPLTTARILWQRYADHLTRQLLRRIAGDEPSGIIKPSS